MPGMQLRDADEFEFRKKMEPMSGARATGHASEKHTLGGGSAKIFGHPQARAHQVSDHAATSGHQSS